MLVILVVSFSGYIHTIFLSFRVDVTSNGVVLTEYQSVRGKCVPVSARHTYYCGQKIIIAVPPGYWGDSNPQHHCHSETGLLPSYSYPFPVVRIVIFAVAVSVYILTTPLRGDSFGDTQLQHAFPP